MIKIFNRLFGKKNHKVKQSSWVNSGKRRYLTELQEKKLFLKWIFDNKIQLDSMQDVMMQYDQYKKMFPDSGYKILYADDMLTVLCECSKNSSVREE